MRRQADEFGLRALDELMLGRAGGNGKQGGQTADNQDDANEGQNIRRQYRRRCQEQQRAAQNQTDGQDDRQHTKAVVGWKFGQRVFILY